MVPSDIPPPLCLQEDFYIKTCKRWDIKLEFRWVSNLITRFLGEGVEYSGRDYGQKEETEQTASSQLPPRVHPQKCIKGEGSKGLLPHKPTVEWK